MVVNIFGASGLVGNHLLLACIESNTVSSIHVFVRKPMLLQHPKLSIIICDFESLDSNKDKIQGDVVFNCLGTTAKVAGSKEKQYEIDCSYPIKIAKLAAANGVKCMVNVSSVGASGNANFYLKTKSDMESGVQESIGQYTYNMRPSFLVGDRTELRIGEKIGIGVFNIVDLLLLGGLRKYRSISASKVASAMLKVAIEKPKDIHIFHYAEIVAYAALVN